MTSSRGAQATTVTNFCEDNLVAHKKISVKWQNLLATFSACGTSNSTSWRMSSCASSGRAFRKTVLMEIIAVLMAPTQGKVTVDGEPIDPARHNISLVLQEPSCLPWRTVWDDIKFGLEIKGVDEKEANDRIERILEIVGLKGYEKYYPNRSPEG